MTRIKLRSISAMFLIFILLIIFLNYRIIISALAPIVLDKFYSYSYVCDSSGFSCVTIVNETGASLNSSIDRYVFDGKFRAIPFIDHNFMKFRDDARLCVVFDGSGRATIYSMYPPDLNHITDEMSFENIQNAPANCARH